MSKQLHVKIKAARLKLSPIILMSRKKNIYVIHHAEGDVLVPQSVQGDDKGAISTGEIRQNKTRVMR